MKLRNWTPALTAARVATWIYPIQHPGYPWLSPRVNTFLDLWLKNTDIGLEFGSGRSTVWLSKRMGSLTSVEHDPQWHRKVETMLMRQKIHNCDYIFASTTFSSQEHQNQKTTPYVMVAERFSENSLDLALVDGVYRAACAHSLIAKIRPGGLLIIDDTQAYYCYPDRTPHPSLPLINQGPDQELWLGVLQQMTGWRQLRVSNRLKTTDIFVKPATGQHR